MNNNEKDSNSRLKHWKIEVLDSKSQSFCGAKWYNSSMWFYNGITASCHHNPGHAIDINEIKKNPQALHNTDVKKLERQMMRDGKKPVNCQFCWVMEEQNPDAISDRVWTSSLDSDEKLQLAFDSDYDQNFDVSYLEVGFDKTCNLACSYCDPGVSSSWVRDIEKHGPLVELKTDNRGLYTYQHQTSVDPSPYVDAFMKWWEQGLYKSLKILRLTGGELVMSKHFWNFFDWLIKNENQSSESTLHLTTNLSYDTKVLNRLLDGCEQLKMGVELWSSTETIGKKAEYVRDGFVWEQWERNFKTVLSHSAIKRCGICTTIAAHNIDGFAEFLRWVSDIKGDNTECLWVSVNTLRFPRFQSVLILPEDLRHKYREDVLQAVADTEHSWSFFEKEQIGRLTDYLIKVNAPCNNDYIMHDSTEYNEVEKIDFDTINMNKDFKYFFQQYDKRRGKSFTETFPELSNWYNNL